MAIYESKLYSTSQETHLKERYIYGVERHGHIREHIEVYNNGVVAPGSDPYVENTLGKRRYELKSYNDNVHVVITDRKVYNNSEDAFEAVDVQKSDYYAFGMSMPGRSIYNEPIRFGYHGMEMDSEHKGDGNHYTTYFRQYDPRLGRWMSRDPESAMFPFESNYAANHNNPVIYVDSEGDSPVLVAFAIGVSTDLVMQFIKGVFSPGRDGKRFDFGYAFKNIDIGDAVINGFFQMLLPAAGVFKEGISPVAKRWIKRGIKYSGKLLMAVIDFRINFNKVEGKIRIEFKLEIAGLDEDNKFRKDQDYFRKDLRLAAIGIFISEIDLISGQLGLFGGNGLFGGLNYGRGGQYRLPEFEGKFYSFYLVNQTTSNLIQQITEGITKGLSLKKKPPKMVSVSLDDIDNHIDAIDQLPEAKKAMGIGEKPSSDNSSNEEIGNFKNQIEKGSKLERNE